MKIVDRILSPGEYYAEEHKKTTVFIHHTAGSHRPDYTIDGWERDRTKSGTRLPVATAYVIGGVSTTDKNFDFDGVIYRAFDDKYWAHHLGTKFANNTALNQNSVAIEICNYGPLTKNRDGIFLNYVNRPVPPDMVEELSVPFKGFTHYQKYTERQLLALKVLLVDIVDRHPGINLNGGLVATIDRGAQAFDINPLACSGTPGLWTHVNTRNDKFDCSPMPQLIELIKSLRNGSTDVV